jgi:putative membrane protein
MKNSILAIGQVAVFAAALAFSASAALAQDKKAADKDSVKFLRGAIEGNYAEIDAGKLAQEKSKNEAVKQYGALLVKDHSAANEKARQAATQLGVTPPAGASVMEKAEYVKFKVLSGATFDRSFAKGMIKDHEAAIKDYQKASAKNDVAGAYAKETLPTLQNHLKEAQSLSKQLQVKQSMR